MGQRGADPLELSSERSREQSLGEVKGMTDAAPS